MTDILSDHSLLSWQLPLVLLPPITLNREIRRWKRLDVDKFRTALLESELCDTTMRPQSADDFFQLSIMTFWLIVLQQSRRSPYDASDSQPGWMQSVDSFAGSHVCLNGAIVVHNNHLIDSSGLSTSERDIKCTGGRNSYTGLCSCLNTPVNRGSCGDH